MFPLLAGRFMLNHDRVRAAVCIGKAGEYGNIMHFMVDVVMDQKEMSLLKDFASGKGGQPIDRYLAKNMTYTADDVCYISAMKYVRDLDYRSAKEQLDKIKDNNYWKTGESDKSWTYNSDDNPPSKAVYIRYDDKDESKNLTIGKKEIVKMLMKLTSPVKDNMINAKNLIAAAEIYKGCDYVSYSDVAWKGSRMFCLRDEAEPTLWFFKSVLPGVDRRTLDKEIHRVQFGAKETAAKYLIKAAGYTKDRELSAQCLGEGADLKVKAYGNGAAEIKLLKEKYADTDFYKSYSNTCTMIKGRDGSKK